MKRLAIASLTLLGTLAIVLQVSFAEEEPGNEMTFRLVSTGGNCFGCEWTAAEGVITENTPDRLRAYLDRYKSGEFVFNSPGGTLVAYIR